MPRIGNTILLLILLVQIATSQEAHDHIQDNSYEFVENQGQWHPLMRFKAQIPYGNLYLESDGIVYDQISPKDYHKIQDWRHEHPAEICTLSYNSHSIRMRFSGVLYAPKAHPINSKSHYFNYYLSNDSKTWATKVRPSSGVLYTDIYHDIDFFINGENGIKYEWVINNPNFEKVGQIQTSIEGADSLYLIDGNLIVETSLGELHERKPYAYQVVRGEKVTVSCAFSLKDSILSYHITDPIDEKYPLIIDPELIFSTYSGSVGDNFGFTATYDSKANLYAGGIVDGSNNRNYPVTSGSHDTSFNGGVGLSPANLPCDISISKYDSAGTNLLWATYIGGANDEYPHSLVADRNDDLLIFGTTYSTNYPHTTDAYDQTHAGGTDIIVSKLSSDGTVLIGSTFIGGPANDGLNQNAILKHNYADDYRGDIITDDDLNIYVATCTLSDSLPSINAHQTIKKGGTDGYVFKLDAECKNLLWATYLGGSASDALYSIKLNNENDIFVGGGTASSDLQTTPDVIQPSRAGNADGYIAVFDGSVDTLKRMTYWGTPEYDQVYFIELDNESRVYATGQTEGSIKKTAGTYGEDDKGQFIMRMDSSLKTLDFQTTFGNKEQESNLAPSAFLVDVCEHIYFSGWGSSVDIFNHPGTTRDMEVTADAEQSTTDSNDFYILVLDKDASSLLYATYFGGSVTGDHVDGGTSRFDKKGVIYQSVCSSCPPSTDGQLTQVSDFPTSSGAAFETNPSIRCSNASFKIDLQIKTAVIADFVATPKIGCSPLTVQFENKSTFGDTLFWDFGDGGTSSEINPIHEFKEAGLYEVTLTVIDSNTCNISSIYKRRILVINNSEADISANFDVCTQELTIENNSTDAITYEWDFGDGRTSTEENPSHTFIDTGTYTIKLKVNGNTICEDVDSQVVKVSDFANPEVTLYNVFSPNKDGFNDCFYFDGLNLTCSDFLLQIYNRWGEKVFETDNPRNCWNGAYNNNGEVLPESTYYYVLKIGQKGLNLKTYSGTVTLFL